MGRDMEDRGGTHKEKVDAYFGEIRNYPEENAVIKVRARALECFTRGMQFNHVLDVACGDGKVAYRILDRSKRMTLVDLSESMIQRAKANLPGQMIKKVDFIHGDILETSLAKEGFDLIICTGLMAHINNPIELIKHIASLLKDDGLLFIQHTDSLHWYSLLVDTYRRVLSVFRKEAYTLNSISKRKFLKWCSDNGFIVIERFRSMVSFMLLGPVLKENAKYQIISKLFGDAENKRRQYCGHDYLFMMIKKKIEADE